MGKPRHERQQLNATGTGANPGRGWQTTQASTAQQQIRHPPTPADATAARSEGKLRQHLE
jgi:hypothetical protein